MADREENQDDDLFADLYGDDEPSKTTPTPIKVEPGLVESSLAATTSVRNEPPTTLQTSQKAVDPRGPPTELPEQQEDVPQAAQYDDGFGMSSSGDWSAGRDFGDQRGFNPLESVGGPDEDHSTGSPAIKEDGKMFIGGLNWETTDESLKEYFGQFGEVVECTVMRDSGSGRSRGFGFLTFRDPKTVNIVMVKEHYLDGKIIDPKRAIPRDEQERTSKIFVGGVSQEATESDFKNYFTQFGRVLDATLMMDKDTGRPRGFGFVTFDSESAVENALNHPSLEIKGKMIEVKKAQPRGNLRDRMNANLDDRGDDRFRDHGEQRDGRHTGNGNFPQHMSGGQPAMYGNYSPQMMAAYWQNLNNYMRGLVNRPAGGPIPHANPVMMQQMMNMMRPGMNMSPQMALQLQSQQNQMSGTGGGPNFSQQQGSQGVYSSAFANQSHTPGFEAQQQGARGPFQHASQRDYQPPGPPATNWEGMYDELPSQSFQALNSQPRPTTGGSAARSDGPPPHAPTGPKNASKPTGSFRGVGRGAGASRGYTRLHPYARPGRF